MKGYTYLSLTYVLVHGKFTHVQTHQHRARPVVVECVQSLEEWLEFILSEDVIVVVPSIKLLGVCFEFKAGDDTKVVSGALHAPIKFRSVF